MERRDIAVLEMRMPSLAKKTQQKLKLAKLKTAAAQSKSNLLNKFFKAYPSLLG
ncbi:MAG TPA: hypothetical protein VLF61_02075 [Rhabdochlamydiaceae bacterium]|nr:hypothetical protein [Rhabdochlamydiaceae bacterium]